MQSTFRTDLVDVSDVFPAKYAGRGALTGLRYSINAPVRRVEARTCGLVAFELVNATPLATLLATGEATRLDRPDSLWRMLTEADEAGVFVYTNRSVLREGNAAGQFRLASGDVERIVDRGFTNLPADWRWGKRETFAQFSARVGRFSIAAAPPRMS